MLDTEPLFSAFRRVQYRRGTQLVRGTALRPRNMNDAVSFRRNRPLENSLKGKPPRAVSVRARAHEVVATRIYPAFLMDLATTPIPSGVLPSGTKRKRNPATWDILREAKAMRQFAVSATRVRESAVALSRREATLTSKRERVCAPCEFARAPRYRPLTIG